MWNKTRATALLGIQYPIIQGPFGGRFSSAKLLAAVSNAGGMGSFGLHAYPAEEIPTIAAEIRSLTAKPFALNLWVPLAHDPTLHYHTEDFQGLRAHYLPYFKAMGVPLPEKPEAKVLDFGQQLEAVLKARPAAASFIFGIPEREALLEFKKSGIRLLATATTLEEAQLIEERGFDMVIASGMEAGGHRGSFIKAAEDSLHSSSSLLGQLQGAINIPIIAAGGISDGRAIHSALNQGAAAVQLGTAFLATDESNASAAHKSALFAPEIQTTLTKKYTGRLARVISNSFTKEAHAFAAAECAPYPIQSSFLSPLMQAYRQTDQWEFIAYWSGQPSSRLRHTSATALFQSLADETESIYQENKKD